MEVFHYDIKAFEYFEMLLSTLITGIVIMRVEVLFNPNGYDSYRQYCNRNGFFFSGLRIPAHSIFEFSPF